jgi:GcrA cell cycle regulator
LTFRSEYPKIGSVSGDIDQSRNKMGPFNWASEHSDALREFIGLRLSCSEAAAAINRKFGTFYTRNAVLSRARRMGLMAPRPPESPPGAISTLDRPGGVRPGEARMSWLQPPMAMLKRTETDPLRCVEIEPRHLSLVDLERGDCHYPYGGDEEGEAITFCGHPRRPGSSYCTPHFHLSRGPGAPSERTARIVLLRPTETA